MVIGTMSTPSAQSHSLWEPSTPAEPMVVTHPNRDKPAVQGTRAIVVLLFLLSAALVLIVTVCGWNVLESAWVIQVAYVLIYLTLAFFAARWNRGVLPVGAALAVLLTVFALVAGPFWFDRNHPGFAATNYLNAGLLGVITLLLVPVQILLIAFAMRGFNQGWNVELERPASMIGGTRAHTDAPPHPA
jgi:presenilin-like A22 family membrane protease